MMVQNSNTTANIDSNSSLFQSPQTTSLILTPPSAPSLDSLQQIIPLLQQIKQLHNIATQLAQVCENVLVNSAQSTLHNNNNNNTNFNGNHNPKVSNPGNQPKRQRKH